MSTIKEIKGKITKLHEMNNQYLAEISSIIQERQPASSEVQLISYFTYSFSLTHMNDGENFCLGSYHVYNISGKPITNPYICIKLSANSPFEFSGKYLYHDSKQKMKFSNSWERINDPSEMEEYWLKPQQIQQLEPYQKLSFPDFQIKWTATPSYSGSVLGYTYGDQLQDGIASVNQININGKIDKEDINE